MSFSVLAQTQIDWANVQRLSVLSVLLAIWATSLVLFGSRKNAILAVCLVGLMLPIAQRFVVWGLDFPILRIVILAATFRFLWVANSLRVRVQAGDVLMISVSILIVAATALRQGVDGAISAMGQAIDWSGLFIVFRLLLQTREDFQWASRVVGTTSVVLVAFMVIEWLTTRNVFSVFGGVPEYSVVRNGRLRCQGPFSHPILAGAFLAGWFPVWLGFWFSSKRAEWSIYCVFSCLGVVLSASSAPVSGILIAIVGWAFFPIRRWIPAVRILFAIVLVGLHFMLNHGIASLFSKANIVGGSTGWHRYALIREAQNNLEEWWMFGLDSTAHWGPGLWDCTNQFLRDGLGGGILALAARIFVFVCAFGSVGQAIRRQSAVRVEDCRVEFGIGVAILVHAMVMLSVSYATQAILGVLLILAAAFAARLPGWSGIETPRGGGCSAKHVLTGTPSACERG